MSDGELTQDEISALLRPIHAGNGHGVSQDEIDRLLRIINAKPGSKTQSPRKTEILSQDEINELLRAINAGGND